MIKLNCSPHSVASKWVNEEIRYFKELHGEHSVLAIIVSGEPNATTNSQFKPSQEAFPKALRYEVGEDGKATEPIAGDARNRRDREMALMKLMAGVLGVDFADLWEREKREARKRKIFRGAIGATIVTLGLYFATNTTTNSTNRELENLLKNQTTIEYKLRHDNLTQEQRVKLYDVLDKLKESIANKKSTLEWLGKNRTEFLEHIAKIYNTKGVDEAIKALEANEATREKRKIDSSREYVTLAKLYVEKNQHKKADRSFQKAIDEFFDDENGLEYANFLQKQNQLKKSEAIYNRILKLKLSTSHRATTLNNLANLEEKLNQNQEAFKHYKEALTLYRALAKANPSAFNADVAMTLNNLASLEYKLNQNQEALNHYEEALTLYRALAKVNPSAFNADVAMTLNNLANLEEKLNQNQEALNHYGEALKIYQALAKANPSAFGLDYANSLVIGVWLFDYPKENLKEAKEILLPFRGVGNVEWFLKQIEELESK